MDRVRENFVKRVITLGEYRREVELSTIDFLEDEHSYEFVQVLGRGGFGSVLEMRSENRRVAIKVVIEEYVRQSETELWPKLSNEHVLPVLNIEHIPQLYAYVFIMPLHRSSLCSILQSPELPKDRKGIEKLEHWLYGICKGVNYLHQEGLCHLDLKLSNVLISDNGTPMICDFGSLTRTEGPTKNYVSPVIYRPPECLDVNTTVNGFQYDVYTLGLLCLELYTNQALLSSKTVQNTIPSWSEILYPTIFDILEKKTFEFLVKKTFIMSDVNRKSLCYARDFIRGCININSFKRPSSLDLLQHRLFNGDKDFKDIKNDIWIVRCEPNELKFLINFHTHRAFKRNIPLKAVETFLQSDDKVELEKKALTAETDAILDKVKKEKFVSSCNSDEPPFVELQPQRSKKRAFSEWINRKKQGFCKALSRLCSCCKNTVNST